jgi:hypothetical protein
MLVKGWCCYETRILGAHHGLIYTYALEISMLYIFHIFFKSLNFADAFIFCVTLSKFFKINYFLGVS